MLALSKSQTNSADLACCVDTRNDTRVPCLSVEVSTGCQQPTVGSVISDTRDSLAVAGIIQSDVTSSPYELVLEDRCSDDCCEASNETSSSAELLHHAVAACSPSYCIL